jgi:hypothetical protein
MEEPENKMPPIAGSIEWLAAQPVGIASDPHTPPLNGGWTSEPEPQPKPDREPDPVTIQAAPPVATHTIEHRSFGHNMRVTTITGQNN